MDYETLVYDKCPKHCCGIKLDEELLWTAGEVTEIALPIFGGIWLEEENILVTPEDFLKGSDTKYVKMVLSNFLGEVVNTQIAKANSDIVYSNDEKGIATCYFEVDEELSKTLKPGTYLLEVSMVNTLPEIEGILPERTIFNLMVSKPGGIDVTIL